MIDSLLWNISQHAQARARNAHAPARVLYYTFLNADHKIDDGGHSLVVNGRLVITWACQGFQDMYRKRALQKIVIKKRLKLPNG